MYIRWNLKYRNSRMEASSGSYLNRGYNLRYDKCINNQKKLQDPIHLYTNNLNIHSFNESRYDADGKYIYFERW